MKPAARRRALRRLALTCLLGAGASVKALGGVPPRSLPRMIRLQDELGRVDPAQLQLAIQLDQDLVAAIHTSPELALSIHPVNPGGFVPIDELLPMAPLHPAVLPNGLVAAPPQRTWLLFGLSEHGQARLHALQERLREIEGRHETRGNALVGLSVRQQSMLPTDAAHQHTRWDTWLQSARLEGWYPIWSGSVRELAAESRAES